MLDTKRSYGEHLLRAADKVAGITASLSAIMANVNWPRSDMTRYALKNTENV